MQVLCCIPISVLQASNKKATRGRPPQKLLDQIRDAIQRKHYSIYIEEIYIDWGRCNIPFHRKKHPKGMRAMGIVRFLANLAVAGNVAASTRNQAVCA